MRWNPSRRPIEIKKLTPTRFSYDATFEADIAQSCVVTLDPVRSHIEGSVARDLFLTQTKSFEVDVAPVDEDGREEIASLRYDLAIPVLEETGAGDRSLSTRAGASSSRRRRRRTGWNIPSRR